MPAFSLHLRRHAAVGGGGQVGDGGFTSPRLAVIDTSWVESISFQAASRPP